MELYPLKFRTIFKDKIWGGKKIKTVIGKDFSPLPNCGETWELSGVDGNISEVANGALSGRKLTEVIDQFGAELMGERILREFGNEFPLLIKFIDAADDLSIQVHPDDELAMKRHQSFGKSEMWYIIQSDPGATLISGFNQDLDKDSYKEIFGEGRLMEVLNQEEVKPGDVFYLPAGRIHTIGKGLLLAEIQQTSDVTYRIYDFDRKDAAGNLRELHLEESLDALDYKKHAQYKTTYEDVPDKQLQLVDCPYFTTNKLNLSASMNVDYSGLDCFRIYVCVEGAGHLNYSDEHQSIAVGDVLLVPASITKYSFEPKGVLTLLESYIRK